ncbi:MAG: hypothetical protein C5S49_05245 [Candidatus Methanogaster sp.]|nr:MAG: hypothetical protein C5S49_05245 [ANME-2 cluster archaeon]
MAQILVVEDNPMNMNRALSEKSVICHRGGCRVRRVSGPRKSSAV